MTDEDRLEEIDKKLDRIQDNVNDIQGDVRVLSTLNKGLNREELLNLIHEHFGNSDSKKLTWYYANGSRTIEEISEEADIAKGSVQWAVRELNKGGWLVRNEQNGNAIYDKAEVCTNLGIERELEKELDL